MIVRSDQGVSGSIEKKLAGYRAAEYVEDGMVVGLGTGSTVLYAMEQLASRVKDGLRIQGVPTSFQASMRAREFGIPLTSLEDHPTIDIAIDGADQVDQMKNLIKGRGAAQTRERVVAWAAERFIVVVDAGKLTRTLSAPVPVEVLSFSVPLVLRQLKKMGGSPEIRQAEKKDGPVITDNGNWIIDCNFGTIDDPETMEAEINSLPGVLSCGIFSEFKNKTSVIVGEKEGVRII